MGFGYTVLRLVLKHKLLILTDLCDGLLGDLTSNIRYCKYYRSDSTTTIIIDYIITNVANH